MTNPPIKAQLDENGLSEDKQVAILRLTALWALNESGLGGFLHAIDFPFTGLIVGAIAITLITLILFFAQKDKSLFYRSLIIVLVIKMLVSPHSPITAYFAVAFQAFFALVMYSVMGINFVSILIVCIAAFVETAMQKLITLTLIGGTSLWIALDEFVQYIFLQFASFEKLEALKYILAAYLSIYIFFAILASFFIYSLVIEIQQLNMHEKIHFNLSIPNIMAEDYKKSSSRKWLQFLLYAVLIGFVLVTFFLLQIKQDPSFAVYYVLRTIAIILFLYFVVPPIMTKYLKKFLDKKLINYKAEVDEILSLFPVLKTILLYAWDKSANTRGLRRLKMFFTHTIISLLTYKLD